MFSNIPGNVSGHSSECLVTFPGMFGNVPRNIWQHSPECLATFPRMFSNITQNITFLHSPRSLRSVPRSCNPGFIHSQVGTGSNER